MSLPLIFQAFLSDPDFWTEWLAAPETWVAVIFPFAVMVWVFCRQGTNRVELLLMLCGGLVTGLNSHWELTKGALSLYSANWFSVLLVALYGLRLYKASPLKLAAVSWFSLFATDVYSTLTVAVLPNSLIEFPLGIGGAGFGDALFVVPTILWVGLLLLDYVRSLPTR